MSDYTNIKLHEIGKIVTGKTPETIDPLNYGSDYMFLGPTDLHKHFIISKSEKMISAKGLQSIKGSVIDGLSILVGCIGWDMGNVALVKGRCATNQQINSITQINNSYNPFYIYYWFKQKKQYLYQIASVTRTPMLKKSDFSNIELNIPNKHQQDKVANILIALDAKIELNNRINAELEAMAKTLYDYWFVQFDFPDANGKPYKTSGGKMVWSEELKRDVPEGWEVNDICNVASIKAGGDKPVVFSNEQNEQNNIPIYSNGITNDGLYGFTNKATIQSQSVTVSARGTIGFSVLRNKPFVPIIRLIVITPNLSGSGKYFHEYIKNIVFENSGSVQQQLTVPQISKIRIVYPSEEILKKYGEVTSPMTDKTEILKEENKKLAELRDWLLPMLMNGQVKVN
jgi:type I restriction enzyme S subunit